MSEGTTKDPEQRPFVRRLLAFEKRFDQANRWFVILVLSVMVVMVFVQVVMRRFFGSPLAWAEEAARYMTLWVMFLAMGAGLATGRFVGMEFVVDKAPGKLREMLVYVRLLVVLVFALVVLTQSINLVALVERRNQITPALRLRMSHVYSAIPIGSAVLILKILLLMLKRAIGIQEPVGTSPVERIG